MKRASSLTVMGVALAVSSPVHAQTAAEALCAGRPDCAVRDVLDAGAGPGGERLNVAALSLPSPDDIVTCRPHAEEYWLLSPDSQPTRVLALCNDGYGAAGIGEDRVTVSANRLVHERTGGSAWRWSYSQEIQLRPLRVVAEHQSGFWSLSPDNYEDAEWDWRELFGSVTWWSPPCDTEIVSLGTPDPAPYRYHPIPMLAADAAPDGYAAAALGSCGSQFNGDRRGHVIWGEPSDAFADGGWMRTLLVGPRELMVSVHQADWTTGAASWLHDDHLELWFGPRRSYFDQCLSADESPVQWAVMMADGEVLAAHGDPVDAPRLLSRTVQSEDAGETVTLRLALPNDVEGITVVFSKGDGQSRQLWMTATSRLAFGVLETLGQPRGVPAEAARCAVRDGRLDLVDSGLPAAIDAADY